MDKPIPPSIASSEGVTLLIESSRLLNSRRLRVWDRSGNRWLVFSGGMCSVGQASDESEWLESGEGAKSATKARLNFADYFDDMVEAGNETLECLDRQEGWLRTCAIGRFLEERLGSPHVVHAIKKELALAVRDRIFFYRLAGRLCKQVDRLVVVRVGPDLIGLDAHYGNNLNVIHLNPWSWRTCLLPLAAILLKLAQFLRGRRLMLCRRAPAQVDLATPLVVGFHPQKERHHQPHMDDYLWDEEQFRPQRFLFVRQVYFRAPGEAAALAREVEFLRSQGATYTDIRALPLSPTRLFRTLKDVVALCRSVVREAAQGTNGPAMFHAARRLLFAMLEEEVFLDHWAPKVYLGRDDFDSSHIVRTIVFNHHGIKTIGIPHSAYLPQGLFPHMAYVFYNSWCVYGRGFVEKFWSKWGLSDRVVPVGLDRNDETHALLRTGEGARRVRGRYPYRTILAWFPPGVKGDTGISLQKIREMARAIKAVSAAHPEVGVVVKPRPVAISFYEAMVHAGDLGTKAHILDREISTPYLLAAADVIVSSTVSAVMAQAVCVGKDRVISVDYWDWKGHPFWIYGSSLVVTDSIQLEARLKALVEGRGIDEKALAAVRQDFDASGDGKAIDRYKAEVLAILGCEGGAVCRSSGEAGLRTPRGMAWSQR